MNDLYITFDDAPWEQFLGQLAPGARVDALQLMTLLEGEEEQTLEDAFQTLEELSATLELENFPKSAGNGEAALRLRREEELAASGLNAQALEPNDPLRLYLEELEGLSGGDGQALLPDCLAGDETARVALMNTRLSVVVDIATEFVGRGVLLMDLIQEGNLGLWQAVCRYDGGDFEQLCGRCIRFAMGKVVIEQARNNGVGQKMRRAVEDYREVDERLLSDLGRNPTLEEMAEQLHISAEEAAVIAKTLENIRMMDKVRTVKEPEEAEIAEEENQAVEDTAYFQMRQRIAELLSDLSETDAKLLTLRFGLEGGLPLSPEDAGRKLGLTPEEVVAREAEALARLRRQG